MKLHCVRRPSALSGSRSADSDKRGLLPGRSGDQVFVAARRLGFQTALTSRFDESELTPSASFLAPSLELPVTRKKKHCAKSPSRAEDRRKGESFGPTYLRCDVKDPEAMWIAPRRYIEAIESRLHRMEVLLGGLLGSDDPRAQTLLGELIGTCAATRPRSFENKVPVRLTRNRNRTPEQGTARRATFSPRI